MKTYQKPTITNIPLEESSVATMQDVTVCIGRDARSTMADGAMPCGSTENPFSLTASPVLGCDGNLLYPDPAIVSDILAGSDSDLQDTLRNKGWSFPTLDPIAAVYPNPAVEGCAASDCTPS